MNGRKMTVAVSVLMALAVFVAAPSAHAAVYPSTFVDTYSIAAALRSTNGMGTVAGILKKYLLFAGVPDDGTLTSEQDVIERAKKDNPFLSDLPSSRAATPTASAQPSANLPGGETAATIADAFAKFLVNRAKVELIAYTISTFKDFESENGDVRWLLPLTSSYIEQTPSLTDQAVFLSSLSRFVQTDIENLPAHLPGLGGVDSPRREFYRKLLSSNFGFVLEMTSVLYGDLRPQQQSIMRITADLAEHADKWKIVGSPDAKMADVLSITKLSATVLAGLRREEGRDNFIARANLSDLFSTDAGATIQKRQIFFGLLWLEMSNLKIAGQSAQDSLKRLAIALNSVPPEELSALVDQVGFVQDAYSKIKSSDSEVDKAKELFTMAASSLSLLSSDSLLRLVLGDTSAVRASPGFQLATLTLQDSYNFYVGITGKDYALAFRSISQLAAALQDALPEAAPPSIDQKEYKKLIDQQKTVKDMITKLQSSAAFLAAIAGAQSSDEMEKIIESYALPATSYQAKFMADNIVIDSYAGVLAGWGAAHWPPDSYGAFAPLGVAINWHTPGISAAGIDSFGIMVGLVDFGALVAFRAFHGEATIPSFDARSLFSPSVVVVLGIAKSPISILIGARQTPKLTGISSDDVSYANGVDTQFMIALAADVPVVSLHQW